uniref:Uncharacterized protein n=1 Tax=Alexandrium monilatum TaxID=311494 RepID=A0A6T1N336_9DINO
MASSGCLVRRLADLCVTTSVLVCADITGTPDGDPYGGYAERHDLLCGRPLKVVPGADEEEVSAGSAIPEAHSGEAPAPQMVFHRAFKVCSADDACVGAAVYSGADAQACALFCRRAVLCGELAPSLQRPERPNATLAGAVAKSVGAAASVQQQQQQQHEPPDVAARHTGNTGWTIWAKVSALQGGGASAGALAPQTAVAPHAGRMGFLDCDGSGYSDGRWGRLRELLAADLLAGLPLEDGGPLASLVEELWEGLMMHTSGDITGFISASTSLFFRALQGEEPGFDLDGHCHYGFVALFALQGHLSALRGDAEDAASLLRLPLGPMLGPHLGFDFPESSSWPLRSRDIAALPTCGQVFRERARLRGRS